MKKKIFSKSAKDAVQLSPPWAIFWRDIDALFAEDPDVKVEYDEDDLIINIYVENAEKAYALTQLLPTEKIFGNVKLAINVVPADADDESVIDLFNKAFDGNPLFSYAKEYQKGAFKNSYVVFKPEVIQYFNDDLSDINGNRTTVVAEVAKEVFSDVQGVDICSDVLPK